MDKKKAFISLKEFMDKLSKVISVEDVILYGSLLTNQFKEDSDIDVVVLSSQFKNLEPDERLRLLYRNAVGSSYNLHMYGLTREELEKASKYSILFEIKKRGKSLKQAEMSSFEFEEYLK